MRGSVAVVDLLALAGCGGDARSSLVPADATVYVGLDASKAERLVTQTSRDLGADIDVYRHVAAGSQLEQAVLPHLGTGTVFEQGEGARLVAEASDEDALRREAVALAQRQSSKGLDVDEPFIRLETRRFTLEIVDGRALLDVGVMPGGAAEDLGDTRRYRDAERRLGGAPTLLSDSLAARRDGETLRIVMR